jgi:hypothetical protein
MSPFPLLPYLRLGVRDSLGGFQCDHDVQSSQRCTQRATFKYPSLLPWCCYLLGTTRTAKLSFDLQCGTNPRHRRATPPA